MEAKLKALKVVDLREILTRAAVSIPSKSNKNDLIARILASPAALDVYKAQHSPKAPDVVTAKPAAQASHLEPPAELPLTHHPSSPAQAATSPPVPSITQSSSDTPSTANTSATDAGTTLDVENEKRKARAARFGLPLVEPVKLSSEYTDVAKNAKPALLSSSESPDKLAARAARFGTMQRAAAQITAGANGRKRNAPPVEDADAEELEKRRKRAERFGIPVAGTTT